MLPKKRMLTAKIYLDKGMASDAISVMKRLIYDQNLTLSDQDQISLHLYYANARRVAGDRGLAIEHYNVAAQLCDKHKQADLYLDIQQYICDMEYVQSHFAKALTLLQDAIELSRKEGFILQEGQLNRIKGQIYSILGLYDQAAEVYQTSLNGFQKMNDSIHLGKIYNNLAESLVYSNLEEAVKFNEESLLLNTSLGKKLEIGKAEMIKGMLAIESGEVGIALDWINRSIETMHKVGYQSGIGKALYHKAVAMLAAGKREEAIAISKQSNEYFIHREIPSYQTVIIKNDMLQHFAQHGNMEEYTCGLSDVRSQIQLLDECADDMIDRYKQTLTKSIETNKQVTHAHLNFSSGG